MRSDGDEVYIRTSGGSSWIEEWGNTGGMPLPIKDGGEELGYELLIIWAEILDDHGSVALAV
jgi:hypothetical protein